jgi:ABC-type cobalamin/Fe3+-siderophores transport system ATPase subunit
MVSSQPSPDELDDGGLTLTAEQVAALDALQDFVEGPEKLYLLKGYAGTGKTTLLQSVYRRFAGSRGTIAKLC